VVDATARTGGRGRLTLETRYLTRKFSLKSPQDLLARVSNRRSAFRLANNAMVLDLTELGGAGTRIEITKREE
jgi:hypothetical protein